MELLRDIGAHLTSSLVLSRWKMRFFQAPSWNRQWLFWPEVTIGYHLPARRAITLGKGRILGGTQVSCQQTTFPAGSWGNECWVPRSGGLGDGHSIHCTDPSVPSSETSVHHHSMLSMWMCELCVRVNNLERRKMGDSWPSSRVILMRFTDNFFI